MASGQPPSQVYSTAQRVGQDGQQNVPTDNASAGPGGQPMQLTDEEKDVMRECERESFYLRALPMSAGAMAAAQMLVRSGRWQPHPTLGSFPKTAVLGAIGYLVGKIMYLPVCQQKILDRIPNSNLGVAVRKAKGIPDPAAQESEWEPPASPPKLRDEYKSFDSNPPSSSSQPEGLDDRFRPSMDREVKEREQQEEKKSITYDDLRRRNRQEYEDNMNKRYTKTPGTPSYKDSPLMPQKPWPDSDHPRRTDPDDFSEPQQAPSPPQAPARKKRTNIWGDPIDD
ncbi:OCIA domain-containing protein 1 [Aplysia californica]|uniref:OCIA domain-containing protein 1 n=1 Tax=Aplysia californica TaxID=6500 RepID=A0ABM0JL26_APLCA|nr:OCIA domain-containing protein 1 [Aplysia californica]